jgi:hypothetical protein
MAETFRVVDSVTRLDSSARGAVVVCGSHGALYPAWLAARAGVRAIIFNDAGIGRHSAGVAGVAWLAGLGIAACAVDHRAPPQRADRRRRRHARLGPGDDGE